MVGNVVNYLHGGECYQLRPPWRGMLSITSMVGNVANYLHGGECPLQVLRLRFLSRDDDVDEGGPLGDVLHGLVAGEGDPALVVGPDVVDRQEHAGLAAGRQVSLDNTQEANVT